MQPSDNVKESYSAQYDQSLVEWRNTGAKFKAMNIVELAKGIPFRNMLEVGAGEGSILNWLSQWDFCSDISCVEISESGIELIKSKQIKDLSDILLFDGYKIPYPDDHFDLVICSHVLEHVEHERLLLREIKRVSKYQIFEVPVDFSFYVDRKLNHFLSYGHINIYTPSLFRFLLKSENFNIEKDICHLYNDAVLRMQYRNNSKGYYVTKFKHFLLKLFPYFLGIKPSSYAVLTSKTQKQLSIF
ncbi:class I SAM-dependent methyltransferase [Dyadobacter sp. MSC1_007]|jgi:ubiquinone/menaquinone biosynthesis C-methylase UbiE|uniref:class I SAM-dependent methyltransferase n=1 Tax=Dyadobacter sp. MSC1_007 TaxID=2909264 RepID=UPI00202FB5E8|nr:class I SAM-dependent methyltransferase [Dyadobacter sp. MSC1_007]